MSSSDSEDLRDSPAELLAALHHSYQLLGQLLHVHRDYLLKIINEEIDERLNRRHGASDIVQTALLRVLENFQRTTGSVFAIHTEEDLRRWLRTICLNVLSQQSRDEGRELRDFRVEQSIDNGLEREATSSSATPSSVVGRMERDRLIEDAINSLPEADRLLLRLREFHDFSYMSLAVLLDGESSEPARMRVQRRLTKIRFELGKDDSIKALQ